MYKLAPAMTAVACILSGRAGAMPDEERQELGIDCSKQRARSSKALRSKAEKPFEAHERSCNRRTTCREQHEAHAPFLAWDGSTDARPATLGWGALTAVLPSRSAPLAQPRREFATSRAGLKWQRDAFWLHSAAELIFGIAAAFYPLHQPRERASVRQFVDSVYCICLQNK